MIYKSKRGQSLQQFIFGPVSNWYKVIGCDAQVSLSSRHLLFKAVQAGNTEDKVWPMAHYLPKKHVQYININQWVSQRRNSM